MLNTCALEGACSGRPSMRQERFLETIRRFPQTGTSRPIVRVFQADSDNYPKLWEAFTRVVLAECGLHSRFVADGDWHELVMDPPESVSKAVVEFDGSLQAAYQHAVTTAFSPQNRQFMLLGLRAEGAIVLCVNHLVFDGLSLLVLLRRIAQAAAGRPEVGPCPHALAEQDRAAIAAGACDGARVHWKDHVERYGMWTSLQLPSLAVTPELTRRAARTVRASIPRTDLRDGIAIDRLGGYVALVPALRAMDAMQDQDGRFGVEVITSNRLSRPQAESVDFRTDYLSVGLADLQPASSGYPDEVIRRCLNVHRYAAFPRSMLDPDSSTGLLPTAANVLFRADDDAKLDTERYLAGLGRDITGELAAQPAATSRVQPGIMLSLLRQTDSIQLALNVAEADLDEDRAHELVESWAAGLRSR